MDQKILLILILLGVASALPQQTPIIGIYTLENEDSSFGPSTYIAASYVKFIEMSGAQVVPIFSYSETPKVLELMSKVNGVLFTGGGMALDIDHIWTKNADAILKYAKSQNDKGNVFPIWATCLGFQLMTYLTANYQNVLSHVHNDTAIIHPLNIVNDSSYMFSKIQGYDKEKMTKGNGLLYFNHLFALTVDTFTKNTYLKNFWSLISTSLTPKNQNFVSALEAKNYPFYAVQFHPQKNLFQWKVNADRSSQGASIVQIMSNSFVDKARTNKNKFASDEDFTSQSIYNYHTNQTKMSVTEIYVFPEKPFTNENKNLQIQ